MGLFPVLLLAALPNQLGGELTTHVTLQEPGLGPGLGRSLAPFSDLDGDGIDEYLVGGSGVAYVISGRTATVYFEMSESAASFGHAVSRAGDTNGDGIEDLLVGAPLASPGGSTESGSVYLYSGATGALLYRLDGPSTYDHFGASLCGMNDLNGDGYEDFAVGAPTAQGQWRGAAAVFSGINGSLIRTHIGSIATELGTAIVNAGDLNGDGTSDLLVSAPYASQSGVSDGALYLYSGATGALLRTMVGPCSCGGTGTFQYGTALAMLEDITGDGLGEILVGMPSGEWAGWFNQGFVQVLSGADGTLVHDLAGWTDGQEFGSVVSAAGDVNQDGFADFAVTDGPSRIGAHIYSGATGNLIRDQSVGPFSLEAIIRTSDLNADGIAEMIVSVSGQSLVATMSGADGSELARVANHGSHDFGYTVAVVGDLNGDGLSEIAIGDPSGGLQTDRGGIWVYSADSGSRVLYLEGPAANARLGVAIAPLGDINGDGVADILGGAPSQGNGSGGVYAYSGVTGATLYSIPGNAGDGLGSSLAMLGDINGDTISDFMVGAPGEDRVYAYSGADGSFLWHVDGPASGALFGCSVATVEVDGDGILDLVIGARWTEVGVNWHNGRVYVLSGATRALLFQKSGPANQDSELGFAVANAGDVNGDGIDDILAGAPGESSSFPARGAAFVWSGVDGSLLHEISGSSVDMYIGSDVSSAGDVDLDGHADILLGSDGEGFLLYSGATGALLHRNDEGTLQSRLGQAVAALGDVTGDGTIDFAVGAPYQSGQGVFGSAFIYSFAPGMSTNAYSISAASGQQISLAVNFSDTAALQSYKVLFSTSGAGPVHYGVDIPLTVDSFARQSFQGSYPFPVHNNLHGTLNASGDATATIDFPAGLPSGLIGLRFWLAAIAFAPGQLPEFSSVALPFRITP
jgi:hypothetical protein